MTDLRSDNPGGSGDPPRATAPHRKTFAIAAGGVLIGAIVVIVLVATSGGGHKAVGAAPPEWSGSSWPAFGHDLANTRATKQSPINAANVAQLKTKWTFAFSGVGGYGAFASTPVVVGKTIYLQDLSSNVYALDRATGKVVWRHAFNKPSVGPNGVAYGWGRIYGATETNAFALDPKDGRLIWTRKLTNNNREGIDMAPQLYDHTVLISTVPGAGLTNFYKGGAVGVVHALDAGSGKSKWQFNTVSDGYKLWGNPKVNSGGGLWYPPAVDDRGRVFISVANPAPLYGTRKYPNGSSRPGPDLYTNSLVALDGRTGKRLWYRQAVPHDVRDYDLMVPAIITTVPVEGVPTEVVLVAGKMGKVYAYRAADGKHLWTRSVGKHLNDTGPLPSKPIDIYPGDLGGVETPMASADGRLFVPWVDLAARASATGVSGSLSLNPSKSRGGLAAFDAADGRTLWQQKLPLASFGGAAVANDVVFTSTYDGTVYAFDTRSGKKLWSTKAPAGVNSFAAVDNDTLLVGAAAPGSDKNPRFELVAYSLSGKGVAAAPSKPPANGGSSTAPAKGTAGAGATSVTADEFSFKLSKKTVVKPGTVTFEVTNVGHVVHDFKIDGKVTPMIQPGKSAKLTVTFKKPGDYKYVCTIPGHAAAGMRGVLTVR